MSLLQKQWISKGSFVEEASLFQNFLDLSKKSIQDYKIPIFKDLLDPFMFQDAQKACETVFGCIEKNERILVFGDYDLDGMSGTAQIFLTLKTLGANVSYRLPSRSDGYGLSEHFIDEAHQNNVKLFITTDCGVSNIHEIQKAKDLGIQTIITDHHSVGDEIPPADAILHPLVKTESFPDKDLTGAGVAWFFCAALLRYKYGKENTQALEEKLLEISLLGTVADCGPLRGQNRIISILGLEQVKKSENKGLLKLIEKSGSNKDTLTTETIAFFIAPRLNASGRLAHPRISLELLLGNADRADELEQLNQERQRIVEEFLGDAAAQMEHQSENPCILVKSIDWPGGIIGLISGRIAEQTGKPTIAFEVTEKKITGSCRGPEDFNIAKGLKTIQQKNPEYFYGCGGHAQAAGLSIYPKYYDAFCKEYSEYVRSARGTTPPLPSIEYLGEIEREVHIEEVEELSTAEPFGIGNPSPVFCFVDLQILKIKAVGKDKNHLSLFVKSVNSGQTFSGIFFREGSRVEELFEGQKIDLLAVPEVHEWQNKKSISLKIQDIKV